MIALRPGVHLVDVVRSGVIESVHTGHVVVLAPSGDVLLALGEPDQPVFTRSSNKPLQAVGLLRAGFEPSSDAHVALAAASHSGEPEHQRLVRAMLAEGGLGQEALGCPPDWPLDEASRIATISDGGARSRLAMNCSGKHAAMLRTCLVNGWSLSSYLDADHPLQLALRESVESLTGDPVDATGVDGCGAPLFALNLIGLARAFARLARACDGPESQVASAMRAHPDLVGGTGRSATLLMAGVPGLIAKDGAEGVYAAALPDGSALALKVDDGAQRAADRVVVAALRHLGVDAPVLTELATAPVLGGGRVVGEIRANSSIERRRGVGRNRTEARAP